MIDLDNAIKQLETHKVEEYVKIKIPISVGILAVGKLKQIQQQIDLETHCKTELIRYGGFLNRDYILKIDGSVGEIKAILLWIKKLGN